ncbi:MAG: hypothetical protein NTZ79_06710, partial [Proteobacteria bacterium]|nr:hypothetical protein [Pseudomonadota bacterium]
TRGASTMISVVVCATAAALVSTSPAASSDSEIPETLVFIADLLTVLHTRQSTKRLIHAVQLRGLMPMNYRVFAGVLKSGVAALVMRVAKLVPPCISQVLAA